MIGAGLSIGLFMGAASLAALGEETSAAVLMAASVIVAALELARGYKP